MSLPILNPAGADIRAITERVNVQIRDYNLRRHSQTVANLPSAADMGFGSRTFVTDADTPVFGDVVVGGGAVTIGVWSDLTDWRVG
jgi:hypothetical protein